MHKKVWLMCFELRAGMRKERERQTDRDRETERDRE